MKLITKEEAEIVKQADQEGMKVFTQALKEKGLETFVEEKGGHRVRKYRWTQGEKTGVVFDLSEN